ncbi:hypothetical protein PTE30175_04657 [Pandoraea terrae]|uniref:Lipoprotein n=1 Tax=Pandoraea terrae TaxID=1537710 RepID=A0A5E4YT73_9BURK|nr:hypothetical protein [Pandoraea terrae]VVE52094.1 hypothetical protein PTE30175_04657 [Pandoraea terrae]
MKRILLVTAGATLLTALGGCVAVPYGPPAYGYSDYDYYGYAPGYYGYAPGYYVGPSITFDYRSGFGRRGRGWGRGDGSWHH